MASTSENGFIQPRELDASTGIRAAGRQHFNDATSRLNRGGLGHAPDPLSSPFRANQTPPMDMLHTLDLYEANFLPGHSRSLSGIALRAFVLGITLSASAILTFYFLWTAQPIWRAPFFVFSLSAFHFLEFWTTSYTNTSSAGTASFLLSSNGSAYLIAHSASFIETLASHALIGPLLPSFLHHTLLLLGIFLIFTGQFIRASAMLTAGQSFSHVVAHTKKTTHALITTGVYTHLRHPSYFGYFWWAVGTQLVCGNAICLVGYVVVLWKFFSRRIDGEEELLVRFFGDEYVAFRERTWVGIPLIK